MTTTRTLTPAPVDIRQFDFDPAGRTFTAEMSETHGFGRVFPDAADEGLTIVGVTGRQVVFAVADEVRDADNDVRYWTLRATDGSGFTAVIYND